MSNLRSILGFGVALLGACVVCAAVCLVMLTCDQRFKDPYQRVLSDPTVVVLGFGNLDRGPRGAQCLFKIPSQDCGKQPEWDPATQELPVPLEKLQKIAFENTIGPDPASWAAWKITYVELRRFPSSGPVGSELRRTRQNRWSCQFTFACQEPGRFTSRSACLLLDGTVVPPSDERPQ